MFYTYAVAHFAAEKYYDTPSLLQGFEKMISGMYLGDIARRVLYRMAQESDIFGDGAFNLSIRFILRYVTVGMTLHVIEFLLHKIMLAAY